MQSKIFLTLSFIFILGGFSLIRQSSGQKIEEKFVFCDIGQGDGFVYITSGGSQIVFDSGPGVKITN